MNALPSFSPVGKYWKPALFYNLLLLAIALLVFYFIYSYAPCTDAFCINKFVILYVCTMCYLFLAALLNCGLYRKYHAAPLALLALIFFLVCLPTLLYFMNLLFS